MFLVGSWCAGVHQCAMVVSRCQQNDEPVPHAAYQEQIHFCQPSQISWDPLQVLHTETIENQCFWYFRSSKFNLLMYCSSKRRYIAPEQVPVQFGGLFKEDDPEFTTSDAVTELTIKPSSKETVEIPVTEVGPCVRAKLPRTIFRCTDRWYWLFPYIWNLQPL